MPLWPSPRLQVARAVLRERDAIRSALAGIDAILRAAAVRGDVERQREDNLAATESLLEATVRSFLPGVGDDIESS